MCVCACVCNLCRHPNDTWRTLAGVVLTGSAGTSTCTANVLKTLLDKHPLTAAETDARWPSRVPLLSLSQVGVFVPALQLWLEAEPKGLCAWFGLKIFRFEMSVLQKDV